MAFRARFLRNGGAAYDQAACIYANLPASGECQISYWMSGVPVTSVTVPSASEHRGSFAGYAWEGNLLTSAAGRLVTGRQPFMLRETPGSEWVPAYPTWKVADTVPLDDAGGSGGAGSVYTEDYRAFYADATKRRPLAALPVPTPPDPRLTFVGYFGADGARRTDENGRFLPGDVPDSDADLTWTAAYENRRFGYVEDYFGLGSAALVPIASESGDNVRRVTVSHVGRLEPGVAAETGVWRNPTVTYMVVADTTVAVTLGRAYPGAGRLTGYMIVGCTVETALGQPPTVRVTAVANEGADAINLFDVSVPVSRRHRPQNLLGAVSGGGELLACRLSAGCDPVVVAEAPPAAPGAAPADVMPCASDVVRGRLEVAATTAAYADEAPPAAAGGFALLGFPEARHHVGYKTFGVTMERGI